MNDFENRWHRKERELLGALKDIEGIVTVEAGNCHQDNFRKMVGQYAQVVTVIQDLHCEIVKRDEILDTVRQKINLLNAEVRNFNEVSF